MFILLTIKDVIRIEPSQFGEEHVQTLIKEINRKYSNKVIPEYGLCIAFYDFVEIEDSKVYPGDGACHTGVKFRMILFRPVEGEIIVGTVLSSNMSGIRVSLEFMDDVWIPSYNLPDVSVYDPVRRIWVWHYRDGDQQLDFDINTGEFIRFRVIAIQYNRVEKNNTLVTSEVKNVEHEADRSVRTRTKSIDVQGPEITRLRSSSVDMREDKLLPPNPMALIISLFFLCLDRFFNLVYGDISVDGLGLIKWWIPDESQ